MRVRCICLIVILIGALVLITGCGEEDIMDPEEEIDEPEDPCIQKGPPNTHQFSITPAPGGIISPNQEFTLDFDMVVIEVTVNGISATGSGRTWVVSLILEPGTRTLAVEWTEPDGCTGAQASGPHTVVADED